MLVAGARILVAFGALATLACRTVPLPEPYVIPLPAGMTPQQAEVAVLAGILNAPPPPEYDPTRTYSEQEFNSIIWQGFVGSAHGRSWFPESREGSTIYAAVNTRGLYLRAAIEREPGSLRIRIVESRNLDQSETRIHKRAIQWLGNLEAHIRREVGRMSVLVARVCGLGPGLGVPLLRFYTPPLNGWSCPHLG
jgi:hypothetical protein